MDSALAPLLGGGIENTVTNAQADYRRAYGAFEALDARWEALRVAPMPESLNAGPLIGTVRRITRADMEARASALNAAEIACLTEPRIVDALFDRVGGFVIDSAQSDGALGARLRARGVRFAAVPAAVMSGLDEGLAVAWWPLAPDGGAARVVGLAAPEAVAMAARSPLQRAQTGLWQCAAYLSFGLGLERTDFSIQRTKIPQLGGNR